MIDNNKFYLHNFKKIKLLWELSINFMVDLTNQHVCHNVDMTTNVKMACGIIFNNPNYTYLPRLALCCLIFIK